MRTHVTDQGYEVQLKGDHVDVESVALGVLDEGEQAPRRFLFAHPFAQLCSPSLASRPHSRR